MSVVRLINEIVLSDFFVLLDVILTLRQFYIRYNCYPFLLELILSYSPTTIKRPPSGLSKVAA